MHKSADGFAIAGCCGNGAVLMFALIVINRMAGSAVFAILWVFIRNGLRIGSVTSNTGRATASVISRVVNAGMAVR